MRVVELRDWNERPGLTDEWERLWFEQAEAPIFVHPTWARIWWDHFGQGRRLRLLLVEEEGRAVALAPLFLERMPPAPGRLRMIGAGVTNDFHDWLLPVDAEARAACVTSLMEYLATRRGWLSLELQGFRSDSLLLPLIDQACAGRFMVQRRVGPRNPVVPLRGTWDSYLEARGGNTRRNLGKKQRRLERQGAVRFEHADEQSARAAVDDVIRLHELRWSGRNDATLVSSSAQGREFYRAVIPALVGVGLADVVSLRLDGRAIATQVGFQIGDTYYNYQAAFDPELAYYSPSTLLLAYVLKQAWDRALAVFDFMTGDEPYKYEWAEATQDVTHLTIIPNQPLARMFGRAMDFGRQLRSLRDKMRRNDDKTPMAEGETPTTSEPPVKRTLKTVVVKTSRGREDLTRQWVAPGA